MANERLKAPNNCYKHIRGHSFCYIFCYILLLTLFLGIFCNMFIVHWLSLLLSCCLFLYYSGNLECKIENFSILVLAIIGGYINYTYTLNFKNKSFICCSLLSFLWGEFYKKIIKRLCFYLIPAKQTVSLTKQGT